MKELSVKKLKALVDRLEHDEAFTFLKILLVEFRPCSVYLVGGVVRDALLSRTSKDIDFVVRGVPMKQLQTFLSRFGNVNLVGKHFGVLKFSPTLLGGKKFGYEPFDIALPRRESDAHMTGHYRDVVVKSDYRIAIEEDLSRRDFTINALAWDVRRSQLIDPFGGVHDLLKKKIRAVGDPDKRFREDYSRMLRAIRFSCQLDFSIEERTARSITKQMRHINALISPVIVKEQKKDDAKLRVVPYEVIGRELTRALCANPVSMMDLGDAHGVFKTLIPELLKMKNCPQPAQWHSEGDVWTHTRLALDLSGNKKFIKEFGTSALSPLLFWAVLFHDIGKPIALRTPEKHKVERMHFHGHDRIGGEMTSRIADRLRLSSVARYSVDHEKLAWLVRNHLFALNSDIQTLKSTTLEKYFFRDPELGRTLLQLMFLDGAASVPRDGSSSLSSYYMLRRRLKALSGSKQTKPQLPASLLSGDEIMRFLSEKPGPLIGKAIEALREMQLSKKVRSKITARTFLKKWHKSCAHEKAR